MENINSRLPSDLNLVSKNIQDDVVLQHASAEREGNDFAKDKNSALFNKDEIIEKILDSSRKKKHLENENAVLQKLLSDYIHKQSDQDYLQNVELFQNADKEMFFNILRNIDKKLNEIEFVHQSSIREEVHLKAEISKKEEEYKDLNNAFKELKESVALQSVDSKTGERFTKEQIRELLRKEQDAEEKLQYYELNIIKKKYYLKEIIQKKNSLVEGPMDYGEYEIICSSIENNTEVTKQIQEEIEEIKQNSINMVHILSHLRQKINFLQHEKEMAEEKGKYLEDELNEIREGLFEDKIKLNIMDEKYKNLQQRYVLLQHPRLIEDYKSLTAENQKFEKELMSLKTTYETCMKIVSQSQNANNL